MLKEMGYYPGTSQQRFSRPGADYLHLHIQATKVLRGQIDAFVADGYLTIKLTDRPGPPQVLVYQIPDEYDPKAWRLEVLPDRVTVSGRTWLPPTPTVQQGPRSARTEQSFSWYERFLPVWS